MPNGGTLDDHLKAYAREIVAEMRKVEETRGTDDYARRVMLVEARFGAPFHRLREFVEQYTENQMR